MDDETEFTNILVNEEDWWLLEKRMVEQKISKKPVRLRTEIINDLLRDFMQGRIPLNYLDMKHTGKKRSTGLELSIDLKIRIKDKLKKMNKKDSKIPKTLSKLIRNLIYYYVDLNMRKKVIY